jgi:glycosyltransferase involved in cell wall biosynthesis
MNAPLVLVARGAGGPPGHPLLPRLLHLLGGGWDAHLAVDAPGRDAADVPASAAARVHAVDSLPRLLDRLAPAIVHYTTGNGSETHLGSRVIVPFAENAIEQPDTKVWQSAHALHCESDALAALARQLGNGATRTFVVPPLPAESLLGCPPSWERARTGGPLRVLSVGDLSWRHGYEHAVAAVRRLRDQGVACDYRIVGAGEFEDAIAFACYQLGVDDCVEIVRPTGAGAVHAELAAADVLLNAAVAATSPKPALDAQAAGVPVVTTELPAAGPETAIVVPRRDPEAIAEALVLLAAGSRRRQLAEEGRRAAARANDVDAHLARYAEHYESLLA